MFKKFGTIVKITVVLDQYTGRNKGYVIQIIGPNFPSLVDLIMHAQTRISNLYYLLLLFSHRFAFVEYEDRKNAEEAMEKYNGFDVEGRRLKLDWDIGLGKKDIKPARSTGTTAENSTAETSPQPQTHSTTEASTPAENEVQKSDESSPVLPAAESEPVALVAAATEVATDIAATHLTETQQPPSEEEPSTNATTTAPEQHVDGSAEDPVVL